MDPRLNQSGPTVIVLAEHKPTVYGKSGIRLITSSLRRPPADIFDQKIHSCNLIPSILAKIEANAAGADDALMLDTQGHVAETNATHVFMVQDGVVATSHTKACPEGITRMHVLRLCHEHQIPHGVRDISLAEVYRANEIFCTGTMGEIAPIVKVDGRTIGDGKMGPVTKRLSELYGELTANEGEKVV
jgi:branched-chain amino acid aminotransferase